MILPYGIQFPGASDAIGALREILAAPGGQRIREWTTRGGGEFRPRDLLFGVNRDILIFDADLFSDDELVAALRDAITSHSGTLIFKPQNGMTERAARHWRNATIRALGGQTVTADAVLGLMESGAFAQPRDAAEWIGTNKRGRGA